MAAVMLVLMLPMFPMSVLAVLFGGPVLPVLLLPFFQPLQLPFPLLRALSLAVRV